MSHPLCLDGFATEQVRRQWSELYAAAAEIERAKRRLRDRAISMLQADANRPAQADYEAALREIAQLKEQLAVAISEATRLSEDKDEMTLRLYIATSDLDRALALNDRLMANRESLGASTDGMP